MDSGHCRLLVTGKIAGIELNTASTAARGLVLVRVAPPESNVF